MSQIGTKVTASSMGAVLTLTGNSGGPVSPDGGGNINVVGGTGITTIGNGSPNTLTINSNGVTQINGDFGAGATGSTITIHTGYLSSLPNGTSRFTANASTSELSFSDGLGNTVIGRYSAPFSIGGVDNVGLGDGVFSGAFISNNNTGIGNNALNSLTSGGNNTAVGKNAGIFLRTGSQNVLIGHQAGATSGTQSGSYNIYIGDTAGQNYTSSESSNIAINAKTSTVALENHTLRIGDGTGSGNQQLNAAYISGISGVNVGSVATVVSINGDQLGQVTITAGSGISVTPTANSITIATTGSGLAWVNVAGTSQVMAVNTGYIANNAGLVTFTLPVTAAQGSIIRVAGQGVGGWTIIENTGQSINFGSSPTTITTGSLSSSNRFDVVELLCTVANTTFNVLSAQGNLTVV